MLFMLGPAQRASWEDRRGRTTQRSQGAGKERGSETGLVAMPSSSTAYRQAAGATGKPASTTAAQLHRQGQPNPRHKKPPTQRWLKTKANQRPSWGGGRPFFLKVIKSKERSRLHLKEKEIICTSISCKESLWYRTWDHL